MLIVTCMSAKMLIFLSIKSDSAVGDNLTIVPLLVILRNILRRKLKCPEWLKVLGVILQM
jgi:hypothetical protein